MLTLLCSQVIESVETMLVLSPDLPPWKRGVCWAWSRLVRSSTWIDLWSRLDRESYMFKNIRQKVSLIVALCFASVVGSNYRGSELRRLQESIQVSIARVQKYPRDIERMIFGLFNFSVIFGLSLMDCLWNICGLLGMDFSMSFLRFPQPFVCVWAGRAGHGRLREMEGLYWLLLIAYVLGILSVIFLVFCSLTFCKSRNTTARNWGSAAMSTTALSFETHETTNRTGYPSDSDGEDPGTRIYRSFCREMYHTKENWSVLTAAGEGRDIRSRDSCQVCQPETGPLLVVTSTGSKCHCYGCRTTERSKQMTLTKCPICYGKTDVKAEWLNLFCL